MMSLPVWLFGPIFHPWGVCPVGIPVTEHYTPTGYLLVATEVGIIRMHSCLCKVTLSTDNVMLCTLKSSNLIKNWKKNLHYCHGSDDTFRTYPFAKPPCRSLSGASHRSLHFYSIDYLVSALAPHSSLSNCLDNRASFSLDFSLSE